MPLGHSHFRLYFVPPPRGLLLAADFYLYYACFIPLLAADFYLYYELCQNQLGLRWVGHPVLTLTLSTKYKVYTSRYSVRPPVLSIKYIYEYKV